MVVQTEAIGDEPARCPTMDATLDSAVRIGSQKYEVPLLQHAGVVAGSETPAT